MTTTSTKKRQTSRGPLIAGIVGAVIVIALIAAVVLGGSARPGAEFGSPEIDGALPLMPSSSAIDNTSTGLDSPTMVGEDFDGAEVAIEDDGRAKAIVFLAHWCPHCQAEVPRVQEWLNSGGGVEGVDIYAVTTSMNSGRPNYPASEWLEREGWTSPVVRDDQQNSALIAYGAGGFPFWVFVEEDGTVALRTSGETSIADLEAIMTGLVSN
jgi:cytochrome c biogenesis protein CcmG, thiol:disulfide interchange protein DsbE